MANIYERVRAQIAKQDKARKAAEYKAGEHERRSRGARIAAEVRRENRDQGIIEGRIEPRNQREDDLQFEALFGDAEF